MGLPSFEKHLHNFLPIYSWLSKMPPQYHKKSLFLMVTQVLTDFFCQIALKCASGFILASNLKVFATKVHYVLVHMAVL